MKKIDFKAKRTQDLIFCLLILLIPMAQFAIFYVGVNINSFVMIFQKYEVDATGRGQYVPVDSLFSNVEELLKPENVEQYGFELEFKYPIVEDAFDSLTFISINPKQQETIGKYTVMQDSLNLRKYIVKPVEKLQVGYEYKLKIPHRKFKDINGFYNDSTDVKVSLPNDDKLSTMFLNLANVNNKYIIDLLNEKRTEVLRSYIIDKDQTLTFPYLKAGKYSIRITEDINRNGIVDTGILLEHKQPEKVRFYKLQDGTFLIDIPEMTEIEQNIDITEMFK